jgi:hypothetical protein
MKSTTEAEQINHPAHYNQGGIECIEALAAGLSPEEFRGFLKGNVIKYLWRANHKGGAEDYKKAAWYLDYLNTHMAKHKEPKHG